MRVWGDGFGERVLTCVEFEHEFEQPETRGMAMRLRRRLRRWRGQGEGALAVDHLLPKLRDASGWLSLWVKVQGASAMSVIFGQKST